MLQRPMELPQGAEEKEEIKPSADQEKEARNAEIRRLLEDESAGEENDDEPLVHPDDLQLDGEDANDRASTAGSSTEESEELGREEDARSGQDAEKQALLDRIAALEALVVQGNKQEEPAQVEIPNLSELKLISDEEDFSDFTLSAEGLNEFSRRIVNVAVQAALQLAQPIITKEAGRSVSAYEYSKEFYNRFPELREKGQLVTELSAKVEAEKPNITPQELFMEVAKRAYKEIGKPMPKSSQRKPGFASVGSAPSSRASKSTLSGVQRDILNMAKVKGRR